MDDATTSHALTESALALAMGFFCILVLALASMGEGEVPPTAAAGPGAGAAAGPAAGIVAGGPGGERMRADDRLVIYFSGRLIGPDRQPVDPSDLAGAGRVVLAVEPGLTLTDLLEVRGRLPVGDLVVTALDDAWRASLAAGAKR